MDDKERGKLISLMWFASIGCSLFIGYKSGADETEKRIIDKQHELRKFDSLEVETCPCAYEVKNETL